MVREKLANLSEDEEKFLDSSLSGLKMNYVEESNKPEPGDSSEHSEKAPSDSKGDTEEASVEKEETDDGESEAAESSDEAAEEK